MDTTMQELGMKNEVNLCDSCCNEIPECTPDNIIYGTGTGSDNIAACSSYEAIEIRHPKHDGAGNI